MRHCFAPEQVVNLNKRLTRTEHLLLFPDRLDSALARPLATWNSEPLFPTVIERAGVLMRGLTTSHAFQDGNKRTAWITTMAYLLSNGTRLDTVEPREAERFVLDIISRQHDPRSAAVWLGERVSVLP